ncbi:MAG: membrane dipeptidase [Xanthomonadales bacterium]|nr:membrane dipeptidase [Xanthomonadales bacterium]
MPGKHSIEDRASRLIADCPNVWDLTIPWVQMYWSIDLLKRYRRAGYTYASLTIQDMPATFEGVRRDIGEFRKLCIPHADWLCFAESAGDIDAARREGKLALGINVQDTELVHDDIGRLEILRDLGVRHMLLAYQVRNRAADGCAEPANGGLSLFGRQLVRRMNEAGIIVDGSHVGKRSSLDAIELSQTPVIFSHSGIKSVCDHIRNIDDEQIQACADAGGVIGIVGIGAFLGDPDASAATVFRHLDHVVQRVGPQHAGIGTDFIDDLAPVWKSIEESGGDAWHPHGPQRYEGVAFAPEQLKELVQIMISSGYDDAAIHGILGGNFRRVYDLVHESPTRSSQSAGSYGD